MKIRVLGAFGAEGLGARPAAFLINDSILVDAGTVTGALPVADQLRIEHALITHSHLDHCVGLAYLTETLAFCRPPTPLTIASIEPVVNALQASIFNNVAWPDFAVIPHADTPIMKYRTLIEGVEQRVGDLWVTPISVNHAVPTAGFIVHDGNAGVVFSGDTGPTEELWKVTRELRGIKAIVLECAFPNRLPELAEIAGHLTPELIRQEIPKLPKDVPVWIYHMKPQFYDEIASELHRVEPDRITIVEQDKTYTV